MTRADGQPEPLLLAASRDTRRIPGWLSISLRLVVSLGLLGILLARVGRPMIQAAREISLVYVAAAFAVAILGIFIGVWKWAMMLGRLGVRVGFGRLLRLYWIGLFYNNFLPSALGGDVVRIAASRLELGGHTMELAASTLGERVTGLLALIVLAAGATASVHLPGLTAAGRLMIAAAGVGLAALTTWLLLDPGLLHVSVSGDSFLARGTRQLQRLRQSLSACTRGFSWFAALMAISVLRQGLLAAMVYLLSFAVGAAIPAGIFFVLVPVACLVWMLPISVNGIGVREWSFVFLFGPFGVPQEEAVLMSLLTWAIMALATAPGGPIQLAAGRRSGVAAQAPAGGASDDAPRQAR